MPTGASILCVLLEKLLFRRKIEQISIKIKHLGRHILTYFFLIKNLAPLYWLCTGGTKAASTSAYP